jgi:hypothetical protein
MKWKKLLTLSIGTLLTLGGVGYWYVFIAGAATLLNDLLRWGVGCIVLSIAIFLNKPSFHKLSQYTISNEDQS